MLAVRNAIPDDYDAYVPLFRELGVDDPTPPREHFALHMVPRTLVATLDGAVAGYLFYELMDGVGYIRNVASDPARRRMGVGAALMTAAKERFAGASLWCLNVKEENVAAIALYERFGLRRAYKTFVTRHYAGTVLPSADGYTIAQLSPDRDAVIEPQFKLLPGQLASARKKPDRSVMALYREDELLGVAVIMAMGAFPFRLSDPAHAGPFMTLLRPLAKPDAEFVQFSAEDDDALAAELFRLGCVPSMELLHMSAPL